MTTIFLLAAALGVLTPRVEVRAVDRPPIVGSLVELGAEGLVVKTPAGPKRIPADRLLGVTFPGAPDSPAPAADVWVQLVDGTELRTAGFTAAGDRAALAGPGQLTRVDTRNVRAVRLRPAAETVAAQWARLLDESSATDRLVVRQGDALNYHLGVLGDVDAERIAFTVDGNTMRVGRAKVFGLIYARPAGRKMPKTMCRLSDTAGGRWNLAELTLGPSGLAVKTPAGAASTLPVETIRRLDFSEGKVVFLSDLTPATVRFTPYFGSPEDWPDRARFYTPREDRALAPAPLRLEGKSYAKGLALHSHTEVEYRLPGEFARFEAVVGIDDRVRPGGNVRLVLTGDGRELFSAVIRGTDPARPIELDLTGVRHLAILVDFGDDLDVGDHLDLCEARLVK